ncbi:MAG: M48 family metallopeptidase [Candidatus Aminicenantes bacterium]|nr:M48 family metallopeptidase [Candidatus Aminicenantes bacterium]
METINFNGISCQVVRRNSRRIRLVFHGGQLRVVLPRHVDPLSIIDQHKKWILEKHEWFRRQLLLAGQLELVRRSKEGFLRLVRDWSRHYAGALGVQPAGIGFRKMKSKWGSCSTMGKISLNTKLQVLPEELIAFIVFHELAHLKVRNHGTAFKALIRAEFPDFRSLDKQLKLFGLKIL